MARSCVVVSLLFAGLFILAGVGWALIGAAILVFAFWPRVDVDTLLAAYVRAAWVWVSRLALRVQAAPRRAVAGSGMAAGMVLAPAGFGVVSGVGAALIAAAVALVGLSLLMGWGA